AGQPRHSDWAGQLDVLWQRPWRQDGGRVAELHRHMQAERGRAVWLVLRCALANRDASDQQDRGLAPTQLEGPLRPCPGLISLKKVAEGSNRARKAVHRTLTVFEWVTRMRLTGTHMNFF